MSKKPDPRLHAYRPDRADSALKGRVHAAHYVSGRPAKVVDPVADLKATPSENAEAVSQVLFGEIVMVFEEANGWAWVQAQGDRYVGYTRASSLDSVADAPTHLVAVPRTPAYAEADLRSPVRAHFSMGSQLTVVGMAQTRGTAYGLLRDGSAVVSSHLQPATFRFDDYVAVAERFLETPYIWAGRSGFGFDCSGLVQLAMLMCGRSVLRDTDMQAASIGRPIDPGADDQGLKRGDLVFWKGHVGIMEDGVSMIHASGHAMRVVRERLTDAVSRIAPLYGQPTGYRRP